jgi:hypothetical protein
MGTMAGQQQDLQEKKQQELQEKSDKRRKKRTEPVYNRP